MDEEIFWLKLLPAIFIHYFTNGNIRGFFIYRPTNIILASIFERVFNVYMIPGHKISTQVLIMMRGRTNGHFFSSASKFQKSLLVLHIHHGMVKKR